MNAVYLLAFVTSLCAAFGTTLFGAFWLIDQIGDWPFGVPE